MCITWQFPVAHPLIRGKLSSYFCTRTMADTFGVVETRVRLPVSSGRAILMTFPYYYAESRRLKCYIL
jgi:hypothetical protein